MVSLEIKNDSIKIEIQRVKREIENINKLIDKSANSEETNELEMDIYSLESELDDLEEELSVSLEQNAFIRKVEKIIEKPKPHKIDSIIKKIKEELNYDLSEPYNTILKELLMKLKECFN